MRRLIAFLGVLALMALARPVSAQQLSAAFGSTMTGGNSASSSFTSTSFFSSVMTKPNFNAIQTKTPTPSPLNFSIGNFLPTFPNLQNTMLMRNVFGSPQMTTQMPSGQMPPPPKKKN